MNRAIAAAAPRRPIVIAIAREELWCLDCGCAGNVSQARAAHEREEAGCPFCGGQRFARADQVLRPGEYAIVQ